MESVMSAYSEYQHGGFREVKQAGTLRNSGGSYGGGSETIVIQYGVEQIMQRVTGTLNPGGHPGSYNGQDAYNDMLVTEDESIKRRKWSTTSDGDDRGMQHVGCHARSASRFDRGGV